jgi:hypothetical protein
MQKLVSRRVRVRAVIGSKWDDRQELCNATYVRS